MQVATMTTIDRTTTVYCDGSIGDIVLALTEHPHK